MIHVSVQVTIDRPASEVFDFMMVQENAHQWLTGLVETRPTSETRGLGYTWIDVVQMFGRRVETEFVVTEFEPNRRLGFESTKGSLPVTGTYSFEPEGEGTILSFNLTAKPSGFFKLAEPILGRMTQRQWETNLANIKDVLETSSTTA